MTKRILSFALVVMMLVTTCISYTASAASLENESATDDSSDYAFGFDMSATLNEKDSSIIDVVLSIKDIKTELDSVELLLTFDPTLVEGVVQKSAGPMDVFMTKVPMYTLVTSGMEIPMRRYEQICTYEPKNKYYHLRFIDLLQYAGAKEGEEYHGLINDGDLVVTVQFRILDTVPANAKFVFEAKNVIGITRSYLDFVSGADNSSALDPRLPAGSKNPYYLNNSNNTMPNVVERTTASEMISDLEKSGITASVTDKDGKALKDNDYVGTGCKATIDGNEYTVIVKGDVDGSGDISSTDYLKAKYYFLNVYPLESEYFQAADTNGDGIISSTDYTQIKGYLVGGFDVYKKFVDLGDDFYANINVPGLDKTFTADDYTNVIADVANGSDAQVWHFVKVDATNAYTITNKALGKYLSIQGDLSAALANVYVSDTEQTFRIFEVNGKYAISPVGIQDKVIDVNGVDFNVQYWSFYEGNICQQYNIVKIEDESSEDSSEDPSEDSSEDFTENGYFGLDMSATLNEEDSSIIDVVLSIKDVKIELDAVEFKLTFDPTLVEGVVQEYETPMDVFMTKVPMYTLVTGGMEFPMRRYEQISAYEPENKYYHLRFIDLLQYQGAKEGEEYHGLINDGDLVVTIQFRILDGVADDAEFIFEAKDVRGTTRGDYCCVLGAENSVDFYSRITADPENSYYLNNSNNTMPNIVERTTVSKMISALESSNITASVTDKDGKALKDNDYVGTGCKVNIDGNEYTVIVKGDTDGSGTISASDYLQIKAHFYGTISLKDEYKAAADVDSNDDLSSTDYLKVKGYFLGNYNLYA